MNYTQTSNRLDLPKVIAITGKLPVAPMVLGQITSMLSDGNSNLDSIAELINQDTSLAAQTLRIANSALYGFRTAATTIEEAVLRTGIREIQRLVGLASSTVILNSSHEIYQTTPEFVWEHGVMTAIAMKHIATRGIGDPSVAYTVGLIRPLGRILISMHVKNSRLDVRFEPGTKSVPEWERGEFGMTYAEVGAAACDNWRFPKQIGSALKYHLDPASHPEAGAFSHMLNLACHIATTLGRGLPGEESLFMDNPDRFRKTGALSEDIEDIVDGTMLEFDRTKTLLSLLRG